MINFEKEWLWICGSYDYRFEDFLSFFLFNDIFKTGSNYPYVTPVRKNAKRQSNNVKKEILVPQPFLIPQYDKYMGGVCHLDWLIEIY